MTLTSHETWARELGRLITELRASDMNRFLRNGGAAGTGTLRFDSPCWTANKPLGTIDAT